MIKSVRTVNVNVSDYDTALGFYVDQLGFSKTQDVPMGPDARWVEVTPPDGGTTLVLSKGADTTSAFTGYIFNTDDIQGTFDSLTARGVNFTKEPSNEPWGKWAQFAEPDGNEFGLWAPPEMA